MMVSLCKHFGLQQMAAHSLAGPLCHIAGCSQFALTHAVSWQMHQSGVFHLWEAPAHVLQPLQEPLQLEDDRGAR